MIDTANIIGNNIRFGIVVTLIHNRLPKNPRANKIIFANYKLASKP